MPPPSRLMLSIDLDEWFHSRRWIDGRQAVQVPDMQAILRRLYGSDRPGGHVIAPTRRLLDLFDRHDCRVTFFVLGEMAEWYPDLIREIADRGHEIACHGLHHVDMTVLGPDVFAAQLRQARDILCAVSGQVPGGYRAPNLVFEPWAIGILESLGFVYDATVCVSRPIGGKYQGWAGAPVHPYNPDYADVGRRGRARLIELPLPPFPVLKLSAGSGIMTRALGYHWSVTALKHAMRSGDTSYYFHPWEVAAAPPIAVGGLKARLFLRRTGDWMFAAVERILQEFQGRVITCGEAAERYARSAAVPASVPTPLPRT